MTGRSARTGRLRAQGLPRLSEVFITSEIYRLERLGLPLRLFVLKAADEDVSTTSYGACASGRTTCSRRPRCPAPDSSVAGRQPRPLPAALLGRRVATRWHRARGRTGAGPGGPGRRGFLAAPRKIYLKEFLLAVDLADRLAGAGDVLRLHAHFAHGTTTVTWLTSTITGIPFSFTGTRRTSAPRT